MRYFVSIFVSSLIICSCSSDNSSELPEEPVINVENIYEEENKWIYSQMNRNYLWRTDLPDSLDCNYNNDPVTFFENLLSDKDQFSYCIRNSSYGTVTQTEKWGFAFQRYSTSNGEIYLQVLYIQSETLKQQGLKRGDWLKECNTNGADSKEFKKYEFTNNRFVETSKTFTASRAIDSTESTVLLDSVYHIGNKAIGYLCYLEYDSEKELEPALEKFKEAGIEELVLDLRYNPGGYVSTCKYLCNCIVDECAYNNIFQIHTYNDILSEELYKETGDRKKTEYYSAPRSSGTFLGKGIIPLNLERIYILTSKNTASASEATIICLQPYMEVIVIGENTRGKGVGSSTLRDSRFKYALQPIVFQYYNADMQTVPNSGIETDYCIANGYQTQKKEIGDIDEPLLSAALSIISGTYTYQENANGTITDNTLEAINQPSFVEEFQLKQKSHEY